MYCCKRFTTFCCCIQTAEPVSLLEMSAYATNKWWRRSQSSSLNIRMFPFLFFYKIVQSKNPQHLSTSGFCVLQIEFQRAWVLGRLIKDRICVKCVYRLWREFEGLAFWVTCTVRLLGLSYKYTMAAQVSADFIKTNECMYFYQFLKRQAYMHAGICISNVISPWKWNSCCHFCWNSVDEFSSGFLWPSKLHM